jgi:D-apiose dehydrogenase
MSPRVALVGAGYFAQFHLQAWLRLAAEGRCQLVAVCDADLTRAQTAASLTSARAFKDLPALLSEIAIDLVDIATPPASHATLLGVALQHDVAAICQKPVAPTLDEALAIAERVAQRNARVWIHENFRWMPWFREMRACIDRGDFGSLHSVAFRLRPGDGQGAQAYLNRQPYFQGMKRFLVHETLIHLIDSFRFLMGEVVAVQAQLRRVNEVIAGEDAGYVLFRFANGATGMIDANRCNDHVAENTRLTMGDAWLEGQRGVMRLDGYGALFWKPHHAPERPHQYVWQNVGFGGDCVYAQQAHVLDALANRSAPVNQLSDYLINLHIEEAIYRADAQRREINISAPQALQQPVASH